MVVYFRLARDNDKAELDKLQGLMLGCAITCRYKDKRRLPLYKPLNMYFAMYFLKRFIEEKKFINLFL